MADIEAFRNRGWEEAALPLDSLTVLVPDAEHPIILNGNPYSIGYTAAELVNATRRANRNPARNDHLVRAVVVDFIDPQTALPVELGGTPEDLSDRSVFSEGVISIPVWPEVKTTHLTEEELATRVIGYMGKQLSIGLRQAEIMGRRDVNSKRLFRVGIAVGAAMGAAVSEAPWSPGYTISGSTAAGFAIGGMLTGASAVAAGRFAWRTDRQRRQDQMLETSRRRASRWAERHPDLIQQPFHLTPLSQRPGSSSAEQSA